MADLLLQPPSECFWPLPFSAVPSVCKPGYHYCSRYLCYVDQRTSTKSTLPEHTQELVATSHPSDDHLSVRPNPAQLGTEPLYFYIGTTGHVVAYCSMPRHCWMYPIGFSRCASVARWEVASWRGPAFWIRHSRSSGFLYKLVSSDDRMLRTAIYSQGKMVEDWILPTRELFLDFFHDFHASEMQKL